MASDDPRQQYRDELQRLSPAAERGDISTDDADAIREFLHAKDANNLTVTDSTGDTLEPSSLATYA